MPRGLLWFLLAGPIAIRTWEYLDGTVFYGEYVHWTGDWAARLLLVTLAATPLRLMFPTASWSRWLLMRRRDLGIATFVYALAHAIAYLLQKADGSRILAEAAEAGMWTGWIAILILAPLAITSNNVAVRALGARWKRLHRMVYLAAVLTFLHWALTAFDPMQAYIHTAILGALFVLRMWQVRRRRRTPS